ncbi:MAG: sulfurtransferase TusA family protein, partial [Arenicellales bacterium]|nr:sulfurtransferase TusA family protein [Arenicellales bacterium]
MTVELDTKGMNCPMPIVKAKKAMKDLGPGDMIRIEATDPGSLNDFPSFCKMGGHELMESSEEGGIFTF